MTLRAPNDSGKVFITFPWFDIFYPNQKIYLYAFVDMMLLHVSDKEHNVFFEKDMVIQWTLQKQIPSIADPVKCHSTLHGK